MARYSKEDLGTLIQKQLDKSLGAPNSEIVALRVRNLQFYRSEAVGELAAPEVPDRSSIVASDAADTVEWMLPALVRMFAKSPDSVECRPRHPRFAPAAKLASEYMRHVFWKKNDGLNVLYAWLKDALVQKVGFAKVTWCEDKKQTRERYKGLLAEQLQDILSGDGVKIVEQAARQEMVPVLDGSGQEILQPVDVFDITVERTEDASFCEVMCVPPEEMRVHQHARYGEKIQFIAQVRMRTRADLESSGYKLDGLSSGSDTSIEVIERNNLQRLGYSEDDEGELERFEFVEAYICLDQDKDGIPEMLRVEMIGGEVVGEEVVDDHPFVEFCPNPVPHLFFGNCPVDFAIEPQRMNTSLLRGLMDNVYLSVNQRMQVVDGQVNMDDMSVSRPGGLVRVREQGAVAPIVQPPLDQGAWQMVEWGEQWRERRTGFTRYSQGMSPDALNPTATGVNLITEKADQRTELIAMVASSAVKRMFTKILKTMGQYQSVPEMVELAGQWVTVDPREWADGYEIEINVGLGTGSKDRRAMAYQAAYQMQQPLVQMGALNPQAAIVAARGFTEASGLSNAEELFPDAQPPQQPPPPPQVAVKQMELTADAQRFQAEQVAEREKRQQELQAEQARMQMQAEVDANRQRVEAEQKTLQIREQLQADLEKERIKSQLEVERMAQEKALAELQAATQIYIAQLGEGKPAPLDTEGAPEMKDALAASIDGFRVAIEQMNRPKTIIRGPDGRPQGIA